ncbi:hypothetical protein UA08_09413 [Talaromyces atroroseus]|uniref:Uncharacterized protein n=1 Tax=Talaromyces atroroseus TaxID=1441469 RepID=A0A1Q5Q6J6_TALAT|nr:hypothetical protein UA08_09413 [Talaromyces atroroseus]OKL55311.1 hypothetical protein UA08_09413 [Talaromyces atroroseus]
MVHSKLPLLALASSALAGVVQREESAGDSEFTSTPAWAASTPGPIEKDSSASIPLPHGFSGRPQGPHSTYVPSAPSMHFPAPTNGPPPFVTGFPGQGEFAHTWDLARPSSIPLEYNHPGPHHSIPPHVFSEPKPSEIHTPPPTFNSDGGAPLYSSSAQPPIPSAHPESPQASSSSKPQPCFSFPATPSQPSEDIHPVGPSGQPERPPWFYGLLPPFDLVSGEEPESPHEGTPPPQPSQSIPGEPPKPQGSSPSESHPFPPPPPAGDEQGHDPVPVADAYPTEPVTNIGGPSPPYGAAPSVPCPYSTAGEHPSGPHPIPEEKPTPHAESYLPRPLVNPTGPDKGEHSDIPPPPQGALESEAPSPTEPAEYPPRPSQPGPEITEPTATPEAELPATSSTTTCTYAKSKSLHPIPPPSVTETQPTKSHRIYGTPPSNPPVPTENAAEKTPSSQSIPEPPSNTDITGAEPSDVRLSSFAPASLKTSIPVGVLVGALSVLAFSLGL